MNSLIKIIQINIIMLLLTFIDGNPFDFSKLMCVSSFAQSTSLTQHILLSPSHTKSSGTKIVNNNVVKKNDAQFSNVDSILKNSIIKIWEGTDGLLNVTAEIVDSKHEIKILVYNMLGKEVRKLYQGLPTERDQKGHYIFTSTAPLNLPKNVYILVIQGNTFKIADKFVIAN